MIDMLRSLHEQAAPFLVAQVWPMVWQSSLLIALVAIANRTVFRRASAQLRYTLWVLVLVRLLLPPSLEVPTSIRHWGTPRVEQYATAMVSKAATTGPTALFESYNAQTIAVESVEAAHGPAAIAPVSMPAAARPWWASMLAAVWIAGVAVLVIVLLARLTRYRRMLREASPPPDWVCVMLEEYRERMKLRLPVHARVVQGYESPALIGLGRLTILLPAHSLASLSAEQLRAVIVHELAHVKRLDFLVNWVQVVLGIAYFFHPLVWFANRQMRIEREHACDDLALITLGLNRKGYADSLLRIAETAAAPHRFAPVQLGVVETRSNLAKRLRRILDQGLRPAPRLTVMSIVIVVAFASVFGTWHYSQAAPVADTEAAAPNDLLSIDVKVLDEAGNPVAGAQLEPFGLRTKIDPGSHYGWGFTKLALETAVTDANGVGTINYPRYVQERLETGKVTVRVSHPDYAPAQPTDIEVDDALPALVLERGATVRVSGFIAREDERVTPVYALLSSQVLPASAPWDQTFDGTLERRNVEPGLHYLWLVYRDDDGAMWYSDALRFEATRGGTHTYNLPLHAGMSVSGTLGDEAPRPIRGGWVEVRVCPEEQFASREFQAGVLQWIAMADVHDDGTFRIDGLPTGHAELIAGCDGAVSNSVGPNEPRTFGKPEAVTLREGANDVVIPMEATSTAIVRVEGPEGQPLSDAEVAFWTNTEFFDYYTTVFGKMTTDSWTILQKTPDELTKIWSAQYQSYQTASGSDGTAVIRDLPAWANEFTVMHEAYELPIRHVGHAADRRVRSIELRPGEETDVVAILEKKGTTMLGETVVAAPKPPAACATSTDDPFAIPVTETSLPTRFEGRVLDESNRPLAGVHVDAWTWCPGNETETAQDGAFALEFEPDKRNIEVRFSKAGYSPVYMYYQPVGALCEPIVMTTRTYFEGTVTGSDGRPVADAIVRADAGPRHADGVFLTDTATEVRTAADGSFHFPVQHDTYTVIVTAGAESAVMRDVAIAQFEAKRLDVTLQPSPTFRARVIDSISKKPVAGVRLSNWRFKEFEGISDAHGSIAIRGIPEGPFEFDVDAHDQGYARWWSSDAQKEWERESIEQDGRQWQRNFDGLTFTIGSDAPEVTIVVEPCARVQGTVIDPEGNAVAGATVAPALTGTGNSITGDTRFSVQTDEHGAFDMLLPASKIREYNLIAHDGKYEEWRQWANGVMAPITTQPGDVVDNVVIQLQYPCVVRGIAVDENGAPAAQREVRAASADKTDNRYFVPTTRTDDDGRFELQYVAEGTHFVQVAPFWLDPEEAPEGTSMSVETSPEHAVEGVELIAQAR